MGALEEIERECGLVGFIVVGGPDPKSGGDLMIMSCVFFTLIVSRQQLLVILRAHTGSTRLGLDFSQAHSGWKTHIEEPFLTYLNKFFSASPSFFYMLTSINSHPAREMRQALALPGTASMQDPSPPSTSATDQCYGSYPRIHSDATEFVGTPEKEPDVVENGTIHLENLFRMLDNNGLHRFSDSDSESEVSVNFILCLWPVLIAS
jgi:hypothetical protein